MLYLYVLGDTRDSVYAEKLNLSNRCLHSSKTWSYSIHVHFEILIKIYY